MTTKDNEKSDLPAPISAPAPGSAQPLLDVMAALRTPVTGCPWDLEQDFASIIPYTIEEAYEVSDAIARDDAVDLRDELGDLLLQVVYHARMAEERGLFEFDDVTAGITDKMIRRHPHVFGSAEERSAGPVKGSWDRIKAEEKAERAGRLATLPDTKRTLSGRPAPTTTEASGPEASARTLRDVPNALPSLTRAIKLQNKAAKVGFDWPSLAPVFDKMKEELAELEDALGVDGVQTSNDAPSPHVIEEFGDLLFVMANVARHMKIDPEAALSAANAKFTRRFEGIEDRLAAAGKNPAQSNLEEMDALWDAVKADEKS